MARERVSGAAAVGIALAFVCGIGGGTLRFVNAGPVERSAQIAGDIAFVLVLVAPAPLALLAARGRPSLFIAAGFLSLVLAFLGLISLVGIVFVPQAILFLVAAGRDRFSLASRARSLAAIVLATLLGTLAFFALFIRDDPVCWATTRDGSTIRLDPGPFVDGNAISMNGAEEPPGTRASGCASDSISTAEATTSAAVVVVMVLASWAVATPRPRAVSPVAAQN